MNWLDLVLSILLVVAAIAGFRKGIIQQATGIAGLLLGIFLAHRFSDALARWVGMSEKWATIVAFILILIVVILVLALIGNIFRKAVKMTGFGVIDRVGGLLLSILKYTLVISLLLGFWVSFSREWKDEDPEIVSESLIYKPMKAVSDAIFPWLLEQTDKLLDEVKEQSTKSDSEARLQETNDL